MNMYLMNVTITSQLQKESNLWENVSNITVGFRPTFSNKFKPQSIAQWPEQPLCDVILEDAKRILTSSPLWQISGMHFWPTVSIHQLSEGTGLKKLRLKEMETRQNLSLYSLFENVYLINRYSYPPLVIVSSFFSLLFSFFCVKKWNKLLIRQGKCCKKTKVTLSI